MRLGFPSVLKVMTEAACKMSSVLVEMTGDAIHNVGRSFGNGFSS